MKNKIANETELDRIVITFDAATAICRVSFGTQTNNKCR